MKTKQMTLYSLKVWKTKEDWDNGEATVHRELSENESNRIDTLITVWNTELLNEETYHFEVYNTVTGETFYHSNEL